MKVLVKRGVEFKYFTPPVIDMIAAISYIYDDEFPDRNPVITSAFDGKHMATSYHYKGLALDFRTRNLSHSEQQKLVLLMRQNLGNDVEVVLERHHVHVEFDPK